MDDATRQENELFEDEVRRIARELWPASQFSGAAKIDGRERDGVFETEECFHLLEATTSRKLAKAENDIEKLIKLVANMKKRSGTKAVKGWFVTRDEPTADQRKCAERHRDTINVLSFAQFQSRLINTRDYLSARDKCVFGSVRHPGTGKGDPDVDFIETYLSDRTCHALRAPHDVIPDILGGHRIVILGDYGAGKSMTLRFLYRRLRESHLSGSTSRFPIYLNLREHYGQTDPSEILLRHAASIGFEPRSHLVRAWRAGYVHLLLDGFDELTPINIQGLWKRLQDNRYRSMEPVRRLLREHPSGVGLAIAGRAHFFDSESERRNAFGDASLREFSLTEFTDDQIREYLEKSGFNGSVPHWLPSRPLLVAYLAARGLLADITKAAAGSPGGLDPAEGWDFLLDKVTAREAEIEAGIDGTTVRRILERLATKARAFQGGLGPLNADMLLAAFNDICGYAPDERGMVLLQRLPGLGIDQGEEETRSFIDEDFVDACRAGDIVEYISNPYPPESAIASPLECGIGSLALTIGAHKARQRGFAAGKLSAAIERARLAKASHLVADLVRLAFEMGGSIDESLYVSDLFITEIELTKALGNVSKVEFHNCLIGRVEIDSDVDSEQLPQFVRCYVGILDGRLSARDLPAGHFQECEFEAFSAESGTTDSVLSLDIPLGVRVLITVLKKLYERRGSGRRENALQRGLDHRSRRLVDDVLRLLQRDGLATPCKRGANTIWLADRSNRKRVGRIIAAPSSVEDPLILAASAIE